MSKILVIVESPGKIKKIGEYLGSDYIVKASFGHCRDLDSKSLSIDVDDNFKPYYTIIPGKNKVVRELRDLQQSCKEVILAADEDREGEMIASSLAGLFVLCSFNEDYLWYYLGGILSVIGTYIIIYYSFVYNKEDPQFHLHHWLIGYIMSLFMICNNPISKVCFAIYYGIFIEGVTIYSLESIFE
jgi:hypothetical protein